MHLNIGYAGIYCKFESTSLFNIPGFTILSLIRMASKEFVYPPKASALKKFPQRPIACPKINPIAPESAIGRKFSFLFLQKPIQVAMAANTPPVNCQSSLTNIGNLQQMLGIIFPLENHIVESGADDSQNNHNQGKVLNIITLWPCLA